jgi:hypothetical protein
MYANERLDSLAANQLGQALMAPAGVVEELESVPV